MSATAGGLRPIPHIAGDGRQRPSLIALAGFEDRMVTSLEVAGDSMLPEIHPGDLVLFTSHSGLIEDGGLHVLSTASGLMVRRLQRMTDGGILTVPSNPACRHEPVGTGSGTEVVGAVIAIVHLHV